MGYRALSPRLLLLGILAGLCAGCTTPARPVAAARLPDRYELETGECQVRSDVKLSADDPLVAELSEVRQQVAAALDLPPYRRPVVVYLFKDENRYAQYMQSVHPTLPPRRAFFIGGPTELAVYAFWSPQVQEDLRHEYTHGLLHSSLAQVPLWLDEGLAEYFEVRHRGTEALHREHARGLAQALMNGWRPDLARLEQLEEVAQMQRADYQEAWAWVHYLLHEAPDGRLLLTDYLKTLREIKPGERPRSLVQIVKAEMPAAEFRLVSHIESLTTGSGVGQVSLSSENLAD